MLGLEEGSSGPGRRESLQEGKSTPSVSVNLSLLRATGACPAGVSLRTMSNVPRKCPPTDRTEHLNWLLDPPGEELSYGGINFHPLQVHTSPEWDPACSFTVLSEKPWARR